MPLLLQRRQQLFHDGTASVLFRSAVEDTWIVMQEMTAVYAMVSCWQAFSCGSCRDTCARVRATVSVKRARF